MRSVTDFERVLCDCHQVQVEVADGSDGDLGIYTVHDGLPHLSGRASWP